MGVKGRKLGYGCPSDLLRLVDGMLRRLAVSSGIRARRSSVVDVLAAPFTATTARATATAK